MSGNGGVLGAGQALVGFHEDALSQAAVGRAQLLLAVVLGLALAADCSELLVLGFVLPAAELQLCIGAHRKHWLGNSDRPLYTRVWKNYPFSYVVPNFRFNKSFGTSGRFDSLGCSR